MRSDDLVDPPAFVLTSLKPPSPTSSAKPHGPESSLQTTLRLPEHLSIISPRSLFSLFVGTAVYPARQRNLETEPAKASRPIKDTSSGGQASAGTKEAGAVCLFPVIAGPRRESSRPIRCNMRTSHLSPLRVGFMSRCEFILLACVVTLTVEYIRKKRAKQPSRSRSSSICPHGCCVCARVQKMGGIDAGDCGAWSLTIPRRFTREHEFRYALPLPRI